MPSAHEKISRLGAICFAVLALLAVLSGAQNSDVGGPPPDDPEEVQAAINNGGSGSFTFSAPASISFPTGDVAMVSGNVIVEEGEVSADSLVFEGAEMGDVEGFKPTGTGYEIASAAELKQQGTVILGGEGIVFSNGVLTAKKAKSFVREGSIASEVYDLEAQPQSFGVEIAQSFQAGCLRVEGIKDVSFTVGEYVEISKRSDEPFHIIDCSFMEYDFEGQGKITLEKKANGKHTIENGTLRRESDGGIEGVSDSYNESIDARNSSAIVETDQVHGFSCVILSPVSSYYYSDPIIEKDFTITIHKEGNNYRLCLRKSAAQQFSSYDGLVDFPLKKMLLRGVVDYKRYTLRDGRIAGLLTAPVYQGKTNVSTTLLYAPDFLFLTDVSIEGLPILFAPQFSETTPHNFIQIQERIIEGERKRLVSVNYLLEKGQITQSILLRYRTDGSLPTITIDQGTMVQDNEVTRVEILEPGHEKIEGMLA